VSAQPVVTVITPVYNGEAHIRECMESVVRQTYEHWEYVVVDNASTDSTPTIAASFAKADSRIRVRRYDEFVDVVASYNRTVAELNPRSAYCKVLGADDWLYPECLERMVSLAEANPSVGLVSAYRLNDGVVDLVAFPYRRKIVAGKEILRQSLLGGPFATGSSSSTLLRADLVRRRDPFFDPSFRHADSDADLWFFTQADLGFVHQVLTYSRRPPRSESSFSDRLTTYAPEAVRLVIRYGPQCLTGAEYRRRLRFVLWLYVRLHLRRALRPSGADHDFHRFHAEALDRVVADAPADPDVRRAAKVIRLLLRRPSR
jgi:glycosyltransferase involved in cell wall biosynthesis